MHAEPGRPDGEKPTGGRILEYASHAAARGDALGTASICLAMMVLAAPVALMQMIAAMYRVFSEPGSLPLYGNPVLLQGALLLTLGIPAAGLVLGLAGLALRCARGLVVLMAVMVNCAGLIAAIVSLLTEA